MAVAWKTKQAMRHLVGKCSLAHASSCLSPVGAYISPEVPEVVSPLNLNINNLISIESITDESKSYACNGQEASVVMPDGAMLYVFFANSGAPGVFQSARVRWRWRVSGWVNDEIQIRYWAPVWQWPPIAIYDSGNPPPTALSYSPWYDLPEIANWSEVDDMEIKFSCIKVLGPDRFTLYLDCAILEVIFI